MTHVMAQVKLMWLLAQPEYNKSLVDLKRGMLTNFVGEVSAKT